MTAADPTLDHPLVRLVVADGVATITLDSPANRNALSRRLLAGLAAALEGAGAAAADGLARAIVLAHTDPVFCAGADLKERAATSSTPDVGPVSIADVFQRLMAAPVPTIAAVRGPVRAGGIGLMAACDLAVVRPDVTFAFAEVRIGVVAALISVPIFRRADVSALVSAFLTGETFDAERARAAGLVTHVADDVEANVATLCDGILAGAPAAVAATLGVLREELDRRAAGSSDAITARLGAMEELSAHHFASAEAAEGMAAFAQRRPPSWAPPP